VFVEKFRGENTNITNTRIQVIFSPSLLSFFFFFLAHVLDFGAHGDMRAVKKVCWRCSAGSSNYSSQGTHHG
jgi:hypothetical protein